MNFVDISIVCPVYNSKNYVKKTIDSIIKQDLKPREIIFIDDGSNDGTPQFITEILVNKNLEVKWKIFKSTHKGPGAARNIGIKNAKSNWISFIDSDDIWEKNKLKKINEIITLNSEVNFITHNEKYLKKDGSIIHLNYSKKYNQNKSLEKQLFQENIFSTSAVTCKKSLFLSEGCFDETLMSAQDYEIWLKLSKKIKIYYLNDFLGTYVERDGNITSKHWIFRLRNELIILNRYRHYVNFYTYVCRLFLLILRFSLKAFFNFFNLKLNKAKMVFLFNL